ncbi:Bromodomain-containing protein, partial [Backusella circina FSU 941]
DKKELFRYPVTPELAADYYDIIKSPMSFEDMLEKLTGHIYLKINEFESDLTLIWTNSMTYNKADTPYYRAAQKLQNIAKGLLSQ